MARNEEKQLARLNRWYLQKQREEDAIKRPPRPKLDTLNTAEDVKKWIPSITRDIDFYIKQMEVPCYPEHVITDFERRINNLKGEYKAFLRKLRELCPEETSIPWADRPYSGKRRKLADATEESASHSSQKDSCEHAQGSFIPLKTPVLDNSHNKDGGLFFAYSTSAVPSSQLCDINDKRQNQPLDFVPSSSRRANQVMIKEKSVSRLMTSKVGISKERNSSPSILDNCGLLSSDEIKAEVPVTINCNEVNLIVPDKSHMCNVNSGDSSSFEQLKRTDTFTSPSLCETKTTHSIPSLNLPYSDSSSEDSDDVT